MRFGESNELCRFPRQESPNAPSYLSFQVNACVCFIRMESKYRSRREDGTIQRIEMSLVISMPLRSELTVRELYSILGIS